MDIRLMLAMRSFSKILLLSSFVGFLSVPSGFAQQAPVKPEDDKTIVIVNGHEIKVSEVQMATDDVLGQLPDLPPKLRYPFIVEFLVERHLLAQQAVKDGLADTEEYKRRLALYQAKALRDAYFYQKIEPSVTEDEIKAAYDKEAAKVAETERIRARHILVATQKEADDIEAKIAAGQKFEDLARQYSLDGSKDYGGDLGYFTASEMVAEFSNTAFALKVGEVSKPVKTDFGWHIIKLEDRKKGAAQPYDQVKGAIRSVLLRKKVQDTLDTLRQTANIEMIDKDLEKYAKAVMDKARAEMQRQSGQAGGDADATGKGDASAPVAAGGKSDGTAPAGDAQPQQ